MFVIIVTQIFWSDNLNIKENISLIFIVPSKFDFH